MRPIKKRFGTPPLTLTEDQLTKIVASAGRAPLNERLKAFLAWSLVEIGDHWIEQHPELLWSAREALVRRAFAVMRTAAWFHLDATQTKLFSLLPPDFSRPRFHDRTLGVSEVLSLLVDVWESLWGPAHLSGGSQTRRDLHGASAGGPTVRFVASVLDWLGIPHGNGDALAKQVRRSLVRPRPWRIRLEVDVD